MPIYEFKCKDCKKKFTVFCTISQRNQPKKCNFCSSKNTMRLISNVRRVRSEEQILEKLADPSALSGIDENDPSSMAKWAKKMAREMGENMDDEIDQMAQEEMTGSNSCSSNCDCD